MRPWSSSWQRSTGGQQAGTAPGPRDTSTSEVGHAAQYVYLQSVALDLGTTEVGAFDDRVLKSVLGLAGDHDLLAIMPIGGSR
jgi:hypothetical protein